MTLFLLEKVAESAAASIVAQKGTPFSSTEHKSPVPRDDSEAGGRPGVRIPRTTHTLRQVEPITPTTEIYYTTDLCQREILPREYPFQNVFLHQLTLVYQTLSLSCKLINSDLEKGSRHGLWIMIPNYDYLILMP